MEYFKRRVEGIARRSMAKWRATMRTTAMGVRGDGDGVGDPVGHPNWTPTSRRPQKL